RLLPVTRALETAASRTGSGTGDPTPQRQSAGRSWPEKRLRKSTPQRRARAWDRLLAEGNLPLPLRRSYYDNREMATECCHLGRRGATVQAHASRRRNVAPYSRDTRRA